MGQLTLQQSCMNFITAFASKSQAEKVITAKQLLDQYRQSSDYDPSYNDRSDRSLTLALGHAVSESPNWIRVKKGIYQALTNQSDSASGAETESISNSQAEASSLDNRLAEVKRYGWNVQREAWIDYAAHHLYQILQLKLQIEHEKVRLTELNHEALRDTLDSIMQGFFEEQQLGTKIEQMCEFISLGAYKFIQKNKKKQKLRLDYIIPSSVFLNIIVEQAEKGQLSFEFVRDILSEQLFTALITKNEQKQLEQVTTTDEAAASSLFYRFEQANIPFMFNAWKVISSEEALAKDAKELDEDEN